jgi:hypothetical protein
MTVWIALLILLGAVGALLLLCRMSVNFKTKRQNDAFDERQKIFQGKAYGFGLLVGAVYFVILSSVLLIMGERKLTADFLSMLIWGGLLLAYTAENCYCLMTGALLPLNSARDSVIGVSYVFAALALFHLVTHIFFHGMSMGDDPVDTWEDLMGVVFWTLHASMYLIAKRREKRDADGQE